MDEKEKNQPVSSKGNIEKEWYQKEFRELETSIFHRPIEDEMNFYKAVQTGEIEYVIKNCETNVFTNPEGMGVLSLNPLQNLKYHFVVTVAMITRFCTEAGLELEKAYRMSDFYIQKADQSSSVVELSELHQTMCLDYTNKMHIISKEPVLSKPIVQCIDYIYDHLHSRITVAELAEHVQLSQSYLSRLFKKEIGMAINRYICIKKVENAKNLLQYSDYSLIDISNYLAFASQSHFNKIFKSMTGMSPKHYRDKYYRKSW